MGQNVYKGIKQTESPTTLIAKDTDLTSTYNGGVSGIIDLTGQSEQVIIYLEWTPGASEAGNELYTKIRFSATNNAFGITPHEIIAKESAVSKLIEKEWRWVQEATFNAYGEFLGELLTTSNSKRLSMYHTPKTGQTAIYYHNGTAFGTVNEKATNAVFTAPGSLAAGTVEWSLATGDLNIGTTDLTSYDGQEIKVDYTTTTNVIRIPVPVRDRFVQIVVRESGIAANAGTIWGYMESNFGRK